MTARLSYANVMATVALLFAMTGGAYAATKYLITSKKQISPKVLKQLKGNAGKQGKTGAVGPAGPTGAVGPAGPTGAVGAQGPVGAEGKEGKEGKEGASVTGVKFTGKRGGCEEGGVEFKVGTTAPTYACNGAAASFPEELPANKTERGAWNVSTAGSTSVGPKTGNVTVSFPMKVEPDNVVYLTETEEAATGCPGKGPSEGGPKAEPGYLCIYAEQEEDIASFIGGQSVDHSGARWVIEGTSAEGSAYGVWAVTAE